MFIEEYHTSGKVYRYAIILLSNKHREPGTACECVSAWMMQSQVLRSYLIKRLINVQLSHVI